MWDLTWVDWLLIALVVVALVSGYSQGFLVGLLSFVGFAVGAIGGLLLIPRLLGGLEPGLGTAVLAVLLVVLVASVGQGLLAWVGAKLRDLLGWRPARVVDAGGGALLAGAGVLIAAWALSLAVTASAIPNLSQATRDSRVLGAVNGVVPISSQRVLGTFEEMVQGGVFPNVVAPFVPEPIQSAQEPAIATTRDPEVRAASGSVVKILGQAPACSITLEGSGFFVGTNRVMTNAHVVAGVRRPSVETSAGERFPATVVYFDPEVDVAVLAVQGLDLPALGFRDDPAAGADAAVVGYPGNGPLSVDEARVRSRLALIGQDIYDDGRVTRNVIAVRGSVRAGNSGGPLVADDGRVYGVIFAASLSDDSTGYALSANQVGDALRNVPATAAVSTGDCRG